MNIIKIYSQEAAAVTGPYKTENSGTKLDISNPESYISKKAIKVEITSQGLKELEQDEKLSFLQKSLQSAQKLHRIEQGSDIRSKYGYVSAGELMEENDPESYRKYSAMLEKAFETDDRNLHFDAGRYMIDWMSDFEKGHPLFQRHQKFYDDWDTVLKSYGII